MVAARTDELNVEEELLDEAVNVVNFRDALLKGAADTTDDEQKRLTVRFPDTWKIVKIDDEGGIQIEREKSPHRRPRRHHDASGALVTLH